MTMFAISVVAFVFAIGILVAVHEWGHYIVARLTGVKVLRFSVGFGKQLWTKRSGPDNTEYCLSAIPLGGYVKLLDEREGDVGPAERHRAFNRVPVPARIAILVAGPLMNFLFAILAFWAMYSVGVPGIQPIVGEVESGSIAAEAGLRRDDRITAVGDITVSTWEGTVLALLDQMLDAQRVALDVADVDGTERRVYLDIGTDVSALTEPGQLFTGLGLTPWSPTVDPVIGEIIPGGTAEAAGLRIGDRVLEAEGQAIPTWESWVTFVQARPGETVEVRLERDGSPLLVALPIGVTESGDGTTAGRIGAGPDVPEDLYSRYVADQRYGFLAAFPVALERTWSMSALTVRMVSSIITGEVSSKNISGPINIAQYAGYSAVVGLSSFLNFLAVVSLSLGILNLLPIPVLDGGQIVYQLLEAVKGGPLSLKAQMVGQQIGIAFLVALMGFAFYNDLTRVFS